MEVNRQELDRAHGPILESVYEPACESFDIEGLPGVARGSECRVLTFKQAKVYAIPTEGGGCCDGKNND